VRPEELRPTVRILFLSDNFPPEVNAPASRTHEHCRAWVAAGNSVTVITCAPNFPRGEVFSGYRNRLWSREELDGIRVVRVWSYITANEGQLRRTLDYVSFMVSATIAALFLPRPDVIVATSPQFFTACAGFLTSRLKRAPYVFELRDLWPESIKAVGAIRGTRLLRALERLELFLYRRAARVVAVTHSFRNNLVRRGIDPGRIDVVTNGVDLSRFSPRPRDAALVAQLQLQGKFVAGYVGTLDMAHGLETILEAAARVRQWPDGERYRFVLLGEGARKQELVRRAADSRLDNVLFLDSVPKSEVARYWSLLDVSIIHLRRDPLFETVIPSKLFECMAMGIPILHGVAGESADIVNRHGVGLVFEPGNADQLAVGLRRLATDAALLVSMRAACVRSAPEYDRRHLADRMLESLRGVSRARVVQEKSTG